MGMVGGRKSRIIVGISGASGAAYGVRALQMLQRRSDIETHLVMSPAGCQTLLVETDWSIDAVRALADVVHSHKNIGASIASGSFVTDGMLVVPCSMTSLSAVAVSNASNLLTRAADVCLKERRPLVLMVRETPLHLGHLRLMAQATENGAIIMPPVPAFYHGAETIDDLVDDTVTRALDVLGIPNAGVRRWKEADREPPKRREDASIV